MKKLFVMLLTLCTVLSCLPPVAAAVNVAQTIEIAAPGGAGNSGEHIDTPDIEMVIESTAGTLGIARALHFNWFTNGLPPEVTVPTFDITNMDYVAFDLYLSRADALTDIPVCIELTSSGTCDNREDSVFLKLNEVTTLTDGWNSVRIPLSLFPTGGADRTGTFAYILGALCGMSREDLIFEYEFTSLATWGARSRNYREFAAFLEKFDALEGNTDREKATSYLKGFAGLSDKELALIYDTMVEKA
jgi:hypothetical protein